jgi:hypothetical protein
MPPRVQTPDARRVRRPTPEPYPRPNKALLIAPDRPLCATATMEAVAQTPSVGDTDNRGSRTGLATTTARRFSGPLRSDFADPLDHPTTRRRRQDFVQQPPMQLSGAQGRGRSTGALLLPEKRSSPVSLVGDARSGRNTGAAPRRPQTPTAAGESRRHPVTRPPGRGSSCDARPHAVSGPIGDRRFGTLRRAGCVRENSFENIHVVRSVQIVQSGGRFARSGAEWRLWAGDGPG